jgi:shikimate dehydrogenase
MQELTELPAILSQMPELVGLNVTIPYKEAVIAHLHDMDETARAVGAVNTIVIKQIAGQEPQLIGYNTDVFGFELSLKPMLQPNHYKALVLGTGGAAKAVTYVLKKLGIDFLKVSRTPNGADEVAYTDLNAAAIAQFPLIINTTPLGMEPNVDSYPDIPYEYITDQHFLYDLVYNPEETVFLQKGKAQGAITQNGFNMLQLQAEKAWEIWNSQSI